MNNPIPDFSNTMVENEEIIYQVPETVTIRYAGFCGFESHDTNVYISNKASIYFKYLNTNNYLYTVRVNADSFIFYKVVNGFATIEFTHQIAYLDKPVNTFPNFFIKCTIKIPIEDMKDIELKLPFQYFADKNNYNESEDEKSTTILSASHLTKIYSNSQSIITFGNKKTSLDSMEQFKALDDISLKIDIGDFVCIMGPSGSGKSTLINNLSTMDIPTNGKVKFKGKDILSLSERDMGKFRYENIGFIFQDFNLIDNLTLKENIAMPLILAGKPKSEILKSINEIAERLEITKYLNKYPSQCSGGQRQRAACARALVSKPKMIIADEPTGNLDTKNSHELLKMFQELNQEQGITILMVTHDNMIASYSHRLIFIRDGKIENILDRGDSTQNEFFHKIVDITSKESQNLINIL